MKPSFYIVIFIAFLSINIHAQQAEEIEGYLLIASYDGDSAEVKDLLKKGANVNIATTEGVTPLMLASQNGHTRIVSDLIDHGAVIDRRAEDGNTALILAIQAGNIETAEFLIRKGANVDFADMNGVSPLMYAIMVDTFYLPDMLIYYDVNVNHSDNYGVNALMMACRYGRSEIAFALLESGAVINVADLNGNTPLHYATTARHIDIMDLLIINGATIDIKNLSGFTPLSVAVSNDYYEGTLLLAGYGADVNTMIRSSLNPLTIAVNNRNDSIARLLRNNGAELLRRPDFSMVSAGLGFTFNNKDSHLKLKFGITDRRFYWMPSISYSIRPVAIKVLDSGDPSVFYQYWERRHLISAGLSKAFFIRRYKGGLTTGAYAGLGGTLSFGSYRGSSENPKTRIVLNPSIGCMLEYEPFRIDVGYEFLDLHLKSYNNNWFSITLHLLINSRKHNILP
jgi:ankyrin repeat protein